MGILIVHKTNLSRRRHLVRSRDYAREHCERLLMIMKDATWETNCVDRVVAADTTSIKDTVEAARQLVATEQEPIRAVLTFAEACVPAVAEIAAELDLPAVSAHTAYIARDKYAMRMALADNDVVSQPRFGLAKTLAEARAQAEWTGYPLILKPIIGTGSMYVRSVDDDAELATHFEFIRRGSWDGFDYDPLHHKARDRYDGALLLEEFVAGPEVSVESLVVRGTTHSIAIHDKPLPTGPTFEEVYACTPTRLPADTVDRLYETTAAVHQAMGIEIGGTHVEYRLRNGTEPVVLEAAARMGGGPIYRSVLLSTGVDMVEAILDMAMGREPVIRPWELPVAVGFRNIFPDRAGVLTAVHGVAPAAADPRVDEIEIYRRVGDRLKVPPQTFQGHGHLIFSAPGQDRLDEVFHELRKIVCLETGQEPVS